MQQLLNADRHLFRIINYTGHNIFFDWLMPWLRNATMWVPLYFFLLLYVTINYKKNAGWWVAFAVATVVCTNFISSTLIKENIFRLRPCNNPYIASWVRVLVAYRPQSSSFTSSHAANHFGMATYWYLTLKNKWGNGAALFFLWAFLISFAQVYVGVHYPIDIACGALIGLVIGYLYAKLFTKNYGL